MTKKEYLKKVGMRTSTIKAGEYNEEATPEFKETVDATVKMFKGKEDEKRTV